MHSGCKPIHPPIKKAAHRAAFLNKRRNKSIFCCANDSPSNLPAIYHEPQWRRLNARAVSG
jgi:hypothetical protein